jgi:hypothetical protein
MEILIHIKSREKGPVWNECFELYHQYKNNMEKYWGELFEESVWLRVLLALGMVWLSSKSYVLKLKPHNEVLIEKNLI